MFDRRRDELGAAWKQLTRNSDRARLIDEEINPRGGGGVGYSWQGVQCFTPTDRGAVIARADRAAATGTDRRALELGNVTV